MKYLFFLIGFVGLAQINPTSFNKIKVTGQTEDNSSTRVVVQDAVSKEFHFVNKNTFNLQNTIDNGNTYTNASETSKVFAISNTSTGFNKYKLDVYPISIVMSTTDNSIGSRMDFGSFTSTNELKQATLSAYDGFKLMLDYTSKGATLKPDNLTAFRDYKFEDKSGNLAVIDKVALDAYTGIRLKPNEDAVGWHVSKSTNQSIGFSAENTNDTDNGALANITVRGSGPLYTNNTGLSHFGASYYIPYLRSNGALGTDKNLFIIGYGATSEVDIRTGTSLNTATSKLKVANDGKITIGVEPTNSASETKILTYGASGEVKVINKIDLTGSMPTVSNSSSLPLSTNTPIGTIYFVSGTNQTYINTGSIWLGL